MPELGHMGEAKIVVGKSVTAVQHSPFRAPVILQRDIKKKIVELEEKIKLRKQLSPVSALVV